MNSFFKKSFSIFILSIMLLGLVSLPVVQAAPLAQTDSALDAAVSYLATQQAEDGGILGIMGTSDASTTARAILALHTNGIDPTSFVSSADNSVVDYLASNYEAYVYDDNGLVFPGSAGLTVAALAVVDQAPADLVDALAATMQADGSYATEAAAEFSSGAATDLSQAFSLLGLALAGQEVPAEAVDYLIGKQLEDGTFDSGFGPDTDTTAIAAIALLANGVSADDAAIQAAYGHFQATQLDNAGWKPGWDTDPVNVDTTGWVLHALFAGGQDLTEWAKDGVSPVDTVLSQQLEDGSIGGTYVNAYSTTEALLGIASAPLAAAPAVIAEPAGPSFAALVVQFGEGVVHQECIAFEGKEITGTELLKLSSLETAIAVDSSMGSLVCGLDSIGCGIDDCFCAMPKYWSYWHQTDGVWAYAESGGDVYMVQNGAVEGWSWIEAAMPEVTFDSICANGAGVMETADLSALETETEAAAEVEEAAPEEETVVEEAVEKEAVVVEAPAEETEQSANNLTLVIFIVLLVIVVVVVVVFLRKRSN